MKKSTRALSVALLAAIGASAWFAACGGTPNDRASTFDAGSDGTSHDANRADRVLVPDSPVKTLGDGSQPTPVSLLLTPAAATVIVTGSGTVSQSFTLQGKLANGDVVSVPPSSVEYDRPDLATAAQPTGTGTIVVTAPPAGSAPYAGTGTLHVVAGALSATATLTVKVQIAEYGAGLSPTSPAVIALNGGISPDAALPDGGESGLDGSFPGSNLPADTAASILYPYDQTVWPLGLTSPRIMWNAPQVGDVYRVHYAENEYSYDGYFTLTQLPAQQPLDQTTWDHLSASNNATHGPDPLSFSLSRYDRTSQKAYLTAHETWTVAPQSLAGAIYYWSASVNAQGVRVGHVSRFQPGTGATPQQLANGECVGCHAVNANGTVLVGDVDDTASSSPDAGNAPAVAPYTNGFNGTRAWASFDITQDAAPLSKQTTEYGADLALTPDGKWVVFGGRAVPSTPGSKYISLSDLQGNVVADSGLDKMVLPTSDAGVQLANTMMPAFSPDGTKLAVIISPTANDSFQDNVLPQVPSPNPLGLTESIAYLAFDESGPSFNPTVNTLFDSNNAAFQTLGPNGVPWNGLAYPSFNPSSSAVAFHVGQYATGCNSYDVNSNNPSVACGDLGADNGALFIATLADKNPIRMARADTPPAAADAWSAVEPTFNPQIRGGYSWVVFTSLRAFGNQPWPAEVTETPDGGYPDGGQPNGLINAKRRLWVAAVDTTIGAVDPSHPAIYLEGQDDTPNMRAFWTLSSCLPTPGAPGPSLGDAGAPEAGTQSDAASSKDAGASDAGGPACTAGFQCCSGFCENDHCVDVSTVACVGAGGACGGGSPCCNSSVVSCMSGSCTPVGTNK